MSEVKWIKITTDMFENRKIRHLRKLPDGNNIVLIWVMLLSLAGKCNANGMIFLTENIPYTTKMLADELDFEENTVILAIDALERLGMIHRDEYLFISDWEHHQNVEGMDRIREQNRKRVAAYRERQKALPETTEEDDVTLHNVTGDVSVTECNAPRIRIREENKIESKNKREEIEEEKKRESSDAAHTSAEKKKPYGEYGWVRLTDTQYARLLKSMGDAELKRCITYIDESAQSSGNKNKWKDWNLVLQRCHREGWGIRGKSRFEGLVATENYDDDTDPDIPF